MAILTKSSSQVSISSENLTLDDVIAVARDGKRVEWNPAPAFRKHLDQSRETLLRKLDEGEVIYRSQHRLRRKRVLRHPGRRIGASSGEPARISGVRSG